MQNRYQNDWTERYLYLREEMAYSDEISRMKTAREEGLEEGRKARNPLFLQCIRLKKQGFSKEKIAEECQVNIPEVEEILKEIEDL